MSGCWVHRFSVLILMLDSISTEVHYVEICGLSFPGMWQCHAMSEDKLITLFEIQTPSCHQAMAAMVVIVDLIITIYIYRHCWKVSSLLYFHPQYYSSIGYYMFCID